MDAHCIAILFIDYLRSVDVHRTDAFLFILHILMVFEVNKTKCVICPNFKISENNSTQSYNL